MTPVIFYHIPNMKNDPFFSSQKKQNTLSTKLNLQNLDNSILIPNKENLIL